MQRVLDLPGSARYGEIVAQHVSVHFQVEFEVRADVFAVEKKSILNRKHGSESKQIIGGGTDRFATRGRRTFYTFVL